ncbi:phage tail protein [Chitinophagaceae bacterium MMS25-I14]
MATNPGGYYPPVGFHFRVEFLGVGNNNDTRFQAVGGLSVEFQTESYKEGGENRFEHQLPTRAKYPPLTLKRGMLTDSKVISWCLDAFLNNVFMPVQINVTLLNEEHQPLKTWSIYNAWPKKWSVADFNSESSTVQVETLELCYDYFTVQ